MTVGAPARSTVTTPRRVQPLEPPRRVPGTPAERAAVAVLRRAGAMPLPGLVERVAHELYLDEIGRGGWIVDLGIFGGNLFLHEAARALEAGDGVLWAIDDAGGTR